MNMHVYIYIYKLWETVREQTLNGQELVLYLIEQEQFVADIDFPAESVLFGVNNCQVNWDVTTSIHFLVSFRINRQPPAK